tara:strand:+ start:172 stop:609 length:438 start_codon:yes stop_codon:yes gene_type:complete
MSKIKSFRGKMSDNTIDIISLHTNTGSTGYKITKFQLMGPNGNSMIESVVKVYSIPQTTATTDIDFGDNTMLAAGTIVNTNSNVYNPDPIIIFDNMTFNQDIYVTLKGHDHLTDVNYHIELEQIKLDLTENTVATLKDIRNITGQ